MRINTWGENKTQAKIFKPVIIYSVLFFASYKIEYETKKNALKSKNFPRNQFSKMNLISKDLLDWSIWWGNLMDFLSKSIGVLKKADSAWGPFLSL